MKDKNNIYEIDFKKRNQLLNKKVEKKVVENSNDWIYDLLTQKIQEEVIYAITNNNTILGKEWGNPLPKDFFSKRIKSNTIENIILLNTIRFSKIDSKKIDLINTNILTDITNEHYNPYPHPEMSMAIENYSSKIQEINKTIIENNLLEVQLLNELVETFYYKDQISLSKVLELPFIQIKNNIKSIEKTLLETKKIYTVNKLTTKNIDEHQNLKNINTTRKESRTSQFNTAKEKQMQDACWNAINIFYYLKNGKKMTQDYSLDDFYLDDLKNNTNLKVWNNSVIGEKNNSKPKYPNLKQLLSYNSFLMFTSRQIEVQINVLQEKMNYNSNGKKVSPEFIKENGAIQYLLSQEFLNKLSRNNTTSKDVLKEFVSYYKSESNISKMTLKKLESLPANLNYPDMPIFTTINSSRSILDSQMSDTKDCLNMGGKFEKEGINIEINKFSSFLNINEHYLKPERVKYNISEDNQRFYDSINTIGRVIVFESELEDKSCLYISGVSGSDKLFYLNTWKEELYNSITEIATNLVKPVTSIFYDLNPLGKQSQSFFSHEWAEYIANQQGMKKDVDYTFQWEDKKHDGTPVFRLLNPKWYKIKFKRSQNVKGKFFLEGVLQKPGVIPEKPDLIYDKGFTTGIYVPIEELR